MPLFACTKCRCADNTATSGYWTQQMNAHERGAKFEPLCSECNPDPDHGKWHGLFPKQSAIGWKIDSAGYIWRPEEVEGGYLRNGRKIVGEVTAQ